MMDTGFSLAAMKQLIAANGKPQILPNESQDPQIAGFLDLCLEPDPSKRPSATQLLELETFVDNRHDSQETVVSLVNLFLDWN